MDAGVPISDMIGGVAMGLIFEPSTGKFKVLTDIQGIEDANGDMDFKVTGSEKGITALQMDNKAKGLTVEILEQALAQARDGRMRLRSAFRKEIEHTGNHRCWINLLEAVDGKRIQPLSLPQDEFLGNCKRYYVRNRSRK